MGIPGLLKALDGAQKVIHMKEYAGKRVAVDSMVWLHRAMFAIGSDTETLCLAQHECAQAGRNPRDDPALNERLDAGASKFVAYFMRQVQMLINFGVIPVLVFDGDTLPAKKATEADRLASREANRLKASELMRQGKKADAYRAFVSAIDVTPRMVFHVISALRQAKVEYLVAPYEADAQLAYLIRIKHVDAVITEDADLIPFGCHTVIYKLKEGAGQEIKLENLASTTTPIKLEGWDLDMLLHWCILTGCDYLKSLSQLGISTAYKIVKQAHLERGAGCLTAAVMGCVRKAGFVINQEYEDGFRRALLTFRHQTVIDPRNLKTAHLTEFRPLDDASSSRIFGDGSFLGAPLSPTDSKNVALGLVHPGTKEPFDCPRLSLPAGPARASLKKDSTQTFLDSFLSPKPGAASGSERVLKRCKSDTDVEFARPPPAAVAAPQAENPLLQQNSRFFHNSSDTVSPSLLPPAATFRSLDRALHAKSPNIFETNVKKLSSAAPKLDTRTLDFDRFLSGHAATGKTTAASPEEARAPAAIVTPVRTDSPTRLWDSGSRSSCRSSNSEAASDAFYDVDDAVLASFTPDFTPGVLSQSALRSSPLSTPSSAKSPFTSASTFGASHRFQYDPCADDEPEDPSASSVSSAVVVGCGTALPSSVRVSMIHSKTHPSAEVLLSAHKGKLSGAASGAHSAFPFAHFLHKPS